MDINDALNLITSQYRNISSELVNASEQFNTQDGNSFFTANGVAFDVNISEQFNTQDGDSFFTANGDAFDVNYLDNPKSKYIQMLIVLFQPIQDTHNCLATFSDIFSIENAIGTQLDVLGQRVGVSRFLNFQPSDSSVSAKMKDDTYKIAIQAQIAKNQWNGTIGGIYSLWNTIFGNTLQLIIHDNRDMSMTAFIVGNTTKAVQQLIDNGYIIPKPEGVKLTISKPKFPVFAFDEDIEYYQGWDIGEWLQTN